MEKISVEWKGSFYHYYPCVASVVTSHARGRDNAMAVAWNLPLSTDPPLFGVGISPKRFTHELILESGEFVVNFLPFDRTELIAAVAANSGRDVDKFQHFPLSPEPALKVKAPILRDAYAAYECRVVDHRPYGDHEWFVGEILMVHYVKEWFTAEGLLDPYWISPALYLGLDYYTTTKEMVRHTDRQRFRVSGEVLGPTR